MNSDCAITKEIIYCDFCDATTENPDNWISSGNLNLSTESNPKPYWICPKCWKRYTREFPT